MKMGWTLLRLKAYNECVTEKCNPGKSKTKTIRRFKHQI